MKCEHININTYKFEISANEFVGLLQNQGFNVPAGSTVKLRSGRSGIDLGRSTTLHIEIDETNTRPLHAVLPG